VQFKQGRDDVGDSVSLVDNATEVAQVLLAGGDVLGQVGRTGALVPGDDDLRFQGGDGIQAGDRRIRGWIRRSRRSLCVGDSRSRPAAGCASEHLS
jgi:hypothetical protein